MSRNQLVASIGVLIAVLATGAALATYKYSSIQDSAEHHGYVEITTSCPFSR